MTVAGGHKLCKLCLTPIRPFHLFDHEPLAEELVEPLQARSGDREN